MIRSFAEWFEAAENEGLDIAAVIERREIKEKPVGVSVGSDGRPLRPTGGRRPATARR